MDFDLEEFKKKVNRLNEEPSDNSTDEETKLKNSLTRAEKQVQLHEQGLSDALATMTKVESGLIEARINKSKALEALEVFYSTKKEESSLAVERDKEIEDYRSRLPSLLKKIEHEEPIPYKTILDLGS